MAGLCWPPRLDEACARVATGLKTRHYNGGHGPSCGGAESDRRSVAPRFPQNARGQRQREVERGPGPALPLNAIAHSLYRQIGSEFIPDALAAVVAAGLKTRHYNGEHSTLCHYKMVAELP